MDETFKFSIIIAVYNVEEYLQETVDSIINQTLNFEQNVQLILVNDGSEDNSLNIALEYYKKFPENILVLSKENGGQASARNFGLKYARGKYVNFLDSDDYISKNTLEEVYNFFEKNADNVDIVAIPMQLFERVEGPHRLNYKFEEAGILNLVENPNNPLLSTSSSFIKYDSIKNYQFDENLANLEDALIINKILLEKKQYGVINTCNYYYRQRMLRNSTVDNANLKKKFFTSRLKDFYLTLIEYCLFKEENIPLFIQYLMAYDLQWLLKIPTLDIFDNETEIKEFWRVLNNVLRYIDVSVIYDNFNISADVKSFFLYLKGEEKRILLNKENSITINVGKYEFDKLDPHRVWLDIVNLKNNVLSISGIFLSHFPNENISLRVIKQSIHGSNEYLCKYVEYNTVERKNRTFLGIIWKFCYNFDVEIPLTHDVDYDLKFIMDFQYENQLISHEVLLDLNNNVNLSKYAAYIIKEPYIVLFKFNNLYIKPYRFLSVLRYEFSNLRAIIMDKPNFFLQAVIIRLIYFVLYPFMKNKRIWIFGDRPDFADDNAKHLFKYSANLDDGIHKYFVINKDSISFKEMEKINDNIVPFGSFKHKILFLFSEKNIFSYVNLNFINPFFYSGRNLFKGIFKSEQVFLQHGVTKDNISKFIKKYNNNLSLIVTVSDLEKKSFLEKGYNYDESIIQVLGFPRYDNLSNKSQKKQILFMPTWRLQLDTEEKFINSDYFKYLNSSLNDARLFKLLDDYGYTFIFKPHAELVKYLELLNIDKKVVVSLNDSYQDLFNQSAILITDYSSVFFDFSYLMKPVIYYRPSDNYHYDKGYFDYETMGFGEVIQDSQLLFEKIQFYLDNNCKLETKYQKNINNFFKFKDTQNCKRVYDWILNNM